MTTATKPNGAASAQGGYDAFAAFNPDLFKENYERFSSGLNSFAEFQKNSLEAMMASASVYSRAVEQAASEQTSFVKEAYEDGVAATKAVTSAKSAQEAMEVQSDYVRSAIEKNVGFATKVADHWAATTKEAMDPLSKRYGEFVELVQSYRP